MRVRALIAAIFAATTCAGSQAFAQAPAWRLDTNAAAYPDAPRMVLSTPDHPVITALNFTCAGGSDLWLKVYFRHGTQKQVTVEEGDGDGPGAAQPAQFKIRADGLMDPADTKAFIARMVRAEKQVAEARRTGQTTETAAGIMIGLPLQFTGFTPAY